MLLSPLSDFTCNAVANCPAHKKGAPVDRAQCALSVDASGKSGHCLGWATARARPGRSRALRALRSESFFPCFACFAWGFCVGAQGA
jgi:hypothetical protein